MILHVRQQQHIYKPRQKPKPEGKEPNPEGFPTHKLAAKRRKILVHDVMTLLPFLAEASQLQHMAACKKLYYYSAGKADLILLSLLRLHKEGFNKLFLATHLDCGSEMARNQSQSWSRSWSWSWKGWTGQT